MPVFRRVFFVGAMSLMALAPSMEAQSKAAARAAAKTETGYVVSLGEEKLVLSNVQPSGGPGGPPPPGGQQMTFTRTVQGGPGGGSSQLQLGPGDVVRGADGNMTLSEEARKRLTPEQQKRAEEALKNSVQTGGGSGPQISMATEGGPGAGMRVQLGPGDVITGPDGKRKLSDQARKRIPESEHKRIEDMLNGGGPTIVQREVEGPGPGGAPAAGKAPKPSGPLQLTDFTFDKKTKKPASLSKGDKVTVTYTEADGKKIATKIEAAK